MWNEETIWEDKIIWGFPEKVSLQDFQMLPNGFVAALFGRLGSKL